MAINSWLVLLGIILVFAIVVLIELKIEADQNYYNCYYMMEFKDKAGNFKCKGVEDCNKCKNCPYYKRYLKTKEKRK